MRKRLVTRTVKGLSVTVLCVNKETRETSERTFVVTEKYKSEEKLLNAINANYLANELSGPLWAAGVIKTEETSKRYGMPESKFIQLAAEILPKDEMVTNDENKEDE